MTAHSTHTARTGDLSETVPATAQAVTKLTELARRWVSAAVDVDAERHADIALVTYEALANCAEHAYRDHNHPGTMTLRVSHDPTQATVRICITDHGRWIDPTTLSTRLTNSRGRGLMLMRALTDDLTIDGRDDGTTVCLHFAHCPATTPSPPGTPGHPVEICACGLRLTPAGDCASCS
jgi:serine/threonine-protein kinase RsbW